MPSQLGLVLCAAIAEFQATPGAYESSYRRYLGVAPPVPFDPCTGGEWIRQIDPASSLQSVIERGTLRIGHVDAAPYVFRRTASDLGGLDYDTGNALTAIMARHYPGLRPHPEWVLVGGAYTDESAKAAALRDAMAAGEFDVALSGQANIGSELTGVDWLCATNLCFTNFLYTGRDGFQLGQLTTRQEVVDALKTLKDITIAYVANNPGPSTPSAINLLHDVGSHVSLMPSQGSAPLNAWVASQQCHFAVGDGIASSWLALNQWPDATNFNVQVALPANPPQPVAGFTLQGV